MMKLGIDTNHFDPIELAYTLSAQDVLGEILDTTKQSHSPEESYDPRLLLHVVAKMLQEVTGHTDRQIWLNPYGCGNIYTAGGFVFIATGRLTSERVPIEPVMYIELLECGLRSHGLRFTLQDCQSEKPPFMIIDGSTTDWVVPRPAIYDDPRDAVEFLGLLAEGLNCVHKIYPGDNFQTCCALYPKNTTSEGIAKGITLNFDPFTTELTGYMHFKR